MSYGIDMAHRRGWRAAATVLVATALAAACGGASRSDGEESSGGGPTGGDSNSGGTADGGTPNGGAVNESGVSGGGGNGATSGGDQGSGGAPSGGTSVGGTGGGGSPSGGVPSGGASGGGTGSAGGAPSGGASGGEGGSPSGGAPSGGAPTGGMTTGGAQTGGASGQPSCPASPPTDGDACGEDWGCFYENCPGAGLTRAGCLDSVWHVRTTPCCPETVPTVGEACPAEEYLYTCTYSADCPGGNASEVFCDTAGAWTAVGVSPHPCCPAEPPGFDAVTCGPDVVQQSPALIQFKCAWQDCGSYGAAVSTCGASGTFTSSNSSPCQRFFCGDGNSNQDYYCEAGQVCIRFGFPLPGGGRVSRFRCTDNPCPPGVLELRGCISESICPTATAVSLVGSEASALGILVSCSL